MVSKTENKTRFHKKVPASGASRQDQYWTPVIEKQPTGCVRALESCVTVESNVPVSWFPPLYKRPEKTPQCLVYTHTRCQPWFNIQPLRLPLKIKHNKHTTKQKYENGAHCLANEGAQCLTAD